MRVVTHVISVRVTQVDKFNLNMLYSYFRITRIDSNPTYLLIMLRCQSNFDTNSFKLNLNPLIMCWVQVVLSCHVTNCYSYFLYSTFGATSI